MQSVQEQLVFKTIRFVTIRALHLRIKVLLEVMGIIPFSGREVMMVLTSLIYLVLQQVH